MSTPLIKYPLDLTGSSTDNLVTGELQSLAAATNRAFVPNYGPFFTRSLVVRSMPDGTVLTPGTQYKACQLFVDATVRAGEEICAVIVITDPSLGTEYSLDYQGLGGEFSDSTYAIEQMIQALQIDDRAVQWGELLGKPEEYAPAPHLHDLGDIYGWEYVMVMLEQIRQAILTGDDASHAALTQYIDHQDGLITTRLDQDELSLNNHLNDRNNPHQVTATEVGLGNVQNYGVASTAEAQAGTSNILYMTPASTKAAVSQQAGNLIQLHINDHTNPHQVTAVQVGLGNVQNLPVASIAEAQAGTSNTVYMTALRTANAIAALALAPLNAHLADYTNPHQVTKAQVGLGSVSNFGLATTADANAGASNVLYMTPATTASAISSLVGNAFAAHVANLSNPHQVTKAQVGLGSVNNYPDASTAEAQAGAATTRYMTPATTAAAISSQIIGPFNNHLNNHSNPHLVTAAQVGTYTAAVIDSKVAAAASAGGFDGSVGSGGWVIGPGGWCVQWGFFGGGVATAQFKKLFSTKPVVISTPEGTGTTNPSSYRWNTAGVGVGSFTQQSSGFGPSYTHWLAIGHSDGADNPSYTTGGGTGGTGSGGSDPGCVAVNMYLMPDLIAENATRGMWIDGPVYNPDALVQREIEAISFQMQPCLRMVTSSGIELVASTTTPMTGRDGISCTMFPDMFGKEVLVDDNGELRWETVVTLEDVGEQMVALISMNDQNYFAGSQPNRRISSHNLIMAK